MTVTSRGIGFALAALALAACSDNGTTTTGGDPPGGTLASTGGMAGIFGMGGGGGGGGSDGGGSPPDMMGPRQGPTQNVDWSDGDGLAGPILDVSTDDAGNVWAISQTRLFIRPPGASRFLSFGNQDGLHVESFTAQDGSAQVTTLTAVAGARANEAYLGYYGYESDDPFNDTDVQKHLGNGDRITFDPASGKITVKRYEFRCVYGGSQCWEDRSVRRIVVAHRGVAAGHALFGFNHGAVHVFNDVLGDHVHPEIEWVSATQSTIRYSEQLALAINDDGTMWVGSRSGVGLMNWDPDPIAWVTAHFKIAFTTYTDNHEIEVPWGYAEENRAAAVTPDGTLFLASLTKGLSSWNPSTSLSTLKHWQSTPGLPTSGFLDAAADVDGAVWLVTVDGQLLRLDPAAGTVTQSPISDARHVTVDSMVTPRAIYVAREGGISVRVTP